MKQYQAKLVGGDGAQSQFAVSQPELTNEDIERVVHAQTKAREQAASATVLKQNRKVESN